MHPGTQLVPCSTCMQLVCHSSTCGPLVSRSSTSGPVGSHSSTRGQWVPTLVQLYSGPVGYSGPVFGYFSTRAQYSGTLVLGPSTRAQYSFTRFSCVTKVRCAYALGGETAISRSARHASLHVLLVGWETNCIPIVCNLQSTGTSMHSGMQSVPCTGLEYY